MCAIRASGGYLGKSCEVGAVGSLETNSTQGEPATHNEERMLQLDDARWAELRHAYGPATDIPALLLQLEETSRSKDAPDPRFMLWSWLAHQGDIHSASFAAVPHVVRILSGLPAHGQKAEFYHFPTWVEICRQRKTVPVPEALASDYYAALNKLPILVAAATSQSWDEEFLRAALSAIAAAKGYCSVAEAALELSPKVADEFLEWFLDRQRLG